MMYSFNSNSSVVSCGASAYTAEASFPMHTSCTDIALSEDAMIMASIIISILVSVLVAGISLLVLIPAILLAVLLIRKIEHGLRKQAYV